MLRTALKPKWLGLLGIVVLVAVAFIQLGRWQLGVAHDKARADAIKEAGDMAPVALGALLTPHTTFPGKQSGRLVTTTGTYAEGQVLIAGRLLHGRAGYWVLSPLTIPASGAIFPVVRGWTASAVAPDPPVGPITVTASLAPGESPSTGTRPAGQLGSVDLARLVNRWPGDLFNAFGFVQDEVMAGGTAEVDAGPLMRVPPPMPDEGLNGRNAAYAVQWWVFAAFAAYLWVRMVREDARVSDALEQPPDVLNETHFVAPKEQS